MRDKVIIKPVIIGRTGINYYSFPACIIATQRMSRYNRTGDVRFFSACGGDGLKSEHSEIGQRLQKLARRPLCVTLEERGLPLS